MSFDTLFLGMVIGFALGMGVAWVVVWRADRRLFGDDEEGVA